MQKSGNNWIVTPDEIEIENGFNARFNYGNLDELMNSIIENGLKIPLKGVKNGEKFILTDGHRRFKAIQLAYEKGYTDIKIILSPEAKQSQEERVLSMITYNSGKPFEMLEEADIYQRLINWGWKPNEIARKVGKSGQFIRDCISLMSVSTTLKNQIKKGLISGSAVVEMLKKEKDVNVVAEKVEKAIADNDGKKVSSKHVSKPKPNKAQIAELIGSVDNIELQNALKLFVEFQDGTIGAKRFLTAVGTIKLH